jgi:hypothetical protein
MVKQDALKRKSEAVALQAAQQYDCAVETRDRPSRSRRTPRSIPTERAPPADAVGSIGMPHQVYFESWRIPQVLKVYGKSRASLYVEIKAGTFPPPVQKRRDDLV